MTKKLSPAQERALGKVRQLRGWGTRYWFEERAATLEALVRQGLAEAREQSGYETLYRAKGD